MKDMEVIVHAGCQQQVLMGWMPFQPPYPTTHGTLTERLLHVPAIPQQNLLIIAARREDSNTRLIIPCLTERVSIQFRKRGPKTTDAFSKLMPSFHTQAIGIFTCLSLGCVPDAGCCEYCTHPLSAFKKTGEKLSLYLA